MDVRAARALCRLGRAADGDFAMNLIQELEKEQFDRLSAAGKAIPEFGPGDTVIVNVKVVEGDRSRVQAYEGVCIGRPGRGCRRRVIPGIMDLTRKRGAHPPRFFVAACLCGSSATHRLIVAMAGR